MSTIATERQRTSRQICWPAYREHRDYLAEIFPAISHNGGKKIPLALGSKYDLIGTNTGLSVRDVKNFLRAYTFGPKYLRMLKPGARRYALNGLQLGHVTDEEAAHAALQLRTHYELHRAGRVGVAAVERALEAA